MMGVCLVAVLAAMLQAPGAKAQVEDAGEPDPAPDPLETRNDLADVDTALEVLAEAGVPPTREDMSRFLAEDGGSPSTAGGPRLPFQGAVQMRLGHIPREGWDRYAKVTLDGRWLRIGARLRRYMSGGKEVNWSLAAGGDQVELRVGELGLVQGHGLLAAAPGRSASLAADSGLAPPRGRLVTWLGYEDPRVLSGIAGKVRLGPWSLRVLSGRRRRTGEVPGPQVKVVQVVGRHDRWRISAAGLARGAARGVSLMGGWWGRPVSGSVETMIWESGPGIPIAGAAVLQVRWDPTAGSGLEGQFGLSDLAVPPPLASRPAVLPGWAGRGFALRGYTRTGGGTVLRAMVHQGRHREGTGSPSKEGRFLVDLQARRKLSPGIEFAVRYRRTEYRSWSWSNRYPWQPPQEAQPRNRTILSAQVNLERSGMRGRLLVRSFGLDQAGTAGRRTLVGLSGDRRLGPDWRMRGGWVTAWGDPVDLVSAVIPVTGLVLPRHWGHWRSETLLGLEWVVRAARLQVAGSLRYPDPENGDEPMTTLWLKADFRW